MKFHHFNGANVISPFITFKFKRGKYFFCLVFESRFDLQAHRQLIIADPFNKSKAGTVFADAICII